ECNPGWSGDQWSNATECPLKVCCSKSGYCGTTQDFCGDKKVKRPSCDVASTSIEKVIGYYEAWSMTERSCYGMQPEDIPYGVYTHINFAFATIDPQTYRLEPGNSDTESLMKRIGAIRLLQPDIEIWVAVGGWSFNDPWMPTAKTFSEIVSSVANQDLFISSAIRMMNTYGFDGIDIDWEYPVADDRSGRKEDYDNFTNFIKRFRQRLGLFGGLLKTQGISLTLPASLWYLQHFDIVALQKHVDWFNVMTYDMHGAWDILNKWTGPFVNAHTNWTDIQDGLDLLWRNDIDPKKVILGTSFYTRTFQLSDPGCNEPKCGVVSAGNPGKCSNTAGVLLHAEVKDIIKEKKLTPKSYRTEMVKTIHWDNQWTSFDDEQTWRLKLNTARGQCISGIMVWAISQDDTSSTNAMALTRAAGRTVMNMPNFNEQPELEAPPKAIQTCRWSNCGEQCADGFKAVPWDGKTNQVFEDATPCGGTKATFCCPSTQSMPKCTWRGLTPSGDCSPGCSDGEVEVGTQQAGCNLRHQSACCQDTSTTHAYGMCKWYGSADLCAGAGKQYPCPSDHSKRLFAASAGFGGEQTCTRGAKSYCCTEIPDVFTDCAWYTKATNVYKIEGWCEPSCPAGSIRLGRQTGDCALGQGAYCCKGKPEPKIKPKEPGFGGKGAEEFKALLQKYMSDPVCPRTTLHPNLHSWHTTKTEAKRSLDAMAMSDHLMKRDGVCTTDSWTRLIQYSGVFFGHSSSNMTALQTLWDDIFAGAFDEQLTYSSLTTFFKARPNIDRTAVLEWMFYNAIEAGPALRLMKDVESKFCSAASTSKRGLVEGVYDTRENRRAIDSWGDTTSDTANNYPSWERILSGIEAGHLTLHYARWQYQTGTGSGAPPGPFLEVAYWIGPNRGVAPTQAEETNLNLNQYRDRRTPPARPANAPDDRWVVFHLHINPETQVFNRLNGRTRVGIQRVSMFHGQRRTGAQIGWRVDNSQYGDLNARGPGFDCIDVPELTTRNALWYVGTPARGSLPAGSFYDRFSVWANALFNTGYLATPGISPIVRGATFDNNGDIDIGSSLAFLERGDSSSEFFNADPYQVSFTIIRNGNSYTYEFTIPDPGNPP
ncbi:glycoside hydrolase, partial [Westerdykella ornata]